MKVTVKDERYLSKEECDNLLAEAIAAGEKVCPDNPPPPCGGFYRQQTVSDINEAMEKVNKNK